MSLNWTMLTPSRTPVPLPNEMTIVAVDLPFTSGSGNVGPVELTLVDGGGNGSIAPTGSSSSSRSASSAAVSKRTLKANGRIWLTDQRLIFTSAVPSTTLDSFSVPLPSILSTQFEQPTFSANHLVMEVKPTQDGGLIPFATQAPSSSSSSSSSAMTATPNSVRIEIRFKERAMFEFVSLLEKTRERAIYMRRQVKEDMEAEGLPTYTYPEESNTVTMVGGVPVENPPGYEF